MAPKTCSCEIYETCAICREEPAVSAHAPRCAICEGKGWISPDDADRGVQQSGELFNAGYDAGKRAVQEAVSAPAPSLDSAQAALSEALGELRQVCEILKAGDKSAIDAATEVMLAMDIAEALRTDKSAVSAPAPLADKLIGEQLLKRVRAFIEYARYELQPGKATLGDQFPRQADADEALARLDEALAIFALGQQESYQQIEKLRAECISFMRQYMALEATIRTQQAQIEQLIQRWRGEAVEIDDDGDICCAETRRNDAEQLAAVLQQTASSTPEGQK